MNLQQKYRELLLEIGFPEDEIQQHWLDLEKAYSKKSRHYHNLTHIEDMIFSYERYSDHLKFPNEVLYSIFYHDYIYSSSKKDNELKSAEYAVSILPENGNLDNQLVFDAIVATQLHQHNEIEDINWLIDSDLKILASDWGGYQIYLKQIRKEYRIYPNFLYKPGRTKVLKHLLEHAYIFQTEAFRTLYEEKARANIEKEISLLT